MERSGCVQIIKDPDHCWLHLPTNTGNYFTFLKSLKSIQAIFLTSSVADPNFFHPGSASKYFNPKKWFISSLKYDSGCSSRIRILTFYPSRIPDPGVKKRHRIRIRKTAYQRFNSCGWGILNPKKWFLSSRKYDSDCSYRISIPDTDPDLLPIPDPGVKKAPDPGSGSAKLPTRDSTPVDEWPGRPRRVGRCGGAQTRAYPAGWNPSPARQRAWSVRSGPPGGRVENNVI